MSAQQILNTPAVVRVQSRGDSIKVERVATALGAEISNVSMADIAESTELAKETRRLLLEHKVLFFRDQDITAAQHVAFAKRFGELETHPVFESHPEFPELALLYRDSKLKASENIFHTDTSWRPTPSMGSVLRCCECPQIGGDTIWVNMALAYDKLPEAIKEQLAGLYALHDMSHAFGANRSLEERVSMAEKFPAQEHPVVCSHEETGEKLLYVNQGFTTSFTNFKSKFEVRVGSDNALQAIALMTYLFNQAAVPEYHVRLRWRPNTFAFWDNRVTQHYAVQDYFPAPRKMERVTIVGSRPKP